MIRKLESDALVVQRLENDDLLIHDKQHEDFELRMDYELVPELLLALEALYPND